MSLNALKEYTRISKYAKYLPEEKRRETWKEQVDRVMDMHKTKYADSLEDMQEEFDFAHKMLQRKRILGSQRALQFGGKPILDKNARLYNCSAVYIDHDSVFQEIMYLLLCGCGVGFSVQQHHISKLSKVKPFDNKKDPIKEFVIPDSIEGWADAMKELWSAYTSGYAITFDYSQIRPKGAPISSGSKAPGPDGLRDSMEKIQNLLDEVIEARGETQLKSIELYDILMHISNAVLSGGVRRSACICLFSHDDEDMLTAKTGDWFFKHPHRARSNNSAVLVRNETKKETFSNMIDSVRQYGEPAFVFVDDKDTLVNPCLTKDTWIMTKEGPKEIEDLIGKEFVAIVDGKEYNSTKHGFVKTGHKDVYKITTDDGLEVKATNNHMFFTNNEWKELKDIKIGDSITIHNHNYYNWNGEGTFNEGWLLGSVKGDGCISESKQTAYLDFWGEERDEMVESSIDMIYSESLNTYQNITGGDQIAKVGKKRVGSRGLYRLAKEYEMWNGNNKVVSSKMEKLSRDFTIGFLSGWFDADGSIQGNIKKGISIRLCSIDLKDLQAAQRMLLRLGIKSKIYKDRHKEGYRSLPDGKGGYKDYYCKSTNDLVISNDSIFKFQDIINFKTPSKAVKLFNLTSSYKRKPNQTKYNTKVISVEKCGKEDVYDCTIPEVHKFDANGLMSHNCAEIGLYSYDEEGNSGVSFCNLCEINMKTIKTESDFYDACKAAAILGTLQAGYTDFDYLGETTKKIVEREALLGISMTGMMDNPEIAFNQDIQKQGAKIIKATNDKLAKIININPAARLTCIKPSGTSSCILGTASGVHPHHSRRYFRRVQANKTEAPLAHFEKTNPQAVAQSIWTTTDSVVTFLCEIPAGAKMKNDLSAIEMLEHVRLTQSNWVKTGKVKSRCVKEYLSHNVSNTIVVKDDEWDDVMNFIWKNRKYYTGISLLPASGDKDLPQAPFSSVPLPSEMMREYGDASFFSSGLVERALMGFEDNLWLACDYILGILKVDEETEEQKEVKAKAERFANKYLDGDLKKTTYLMKDTYNIKLWKDLEREYKDIDWSTMVEEENTIDIKSDIACSGNSCSLGDLGIAIQEKKDKDAKKTD